jgi:hypothetical protein
MSRPTRRVALIYDARLAYDLQVMSGIAAYWAAIRGCGRCPIEMTDSELAATPHAGGGYRALSGVAGMRDAPFKDSGS